jgi:anti-sigma B factor antagonist
MVLLKEPLEARAMDEIIRYKENVTILELAGSLDISNAHRIRQKMIDVISGESAQVVVNLRDLYFIDSSGLAALVLGFKRAREHQGNLFLCNLRPPVRMILEMTRFDKVFEIFVSEEHAVLAATGLF